MKVIFGVFQGSVLDLLLFKIVTFGEEMRHLVMFCQPKCLAQKQGVFPGGKIYKIPPS